MQGEPVDLGGYYFVDRDKAKPLGIDMSTVTSVLNNAYSQLQISTIYDSLN